MREYAVMVFLGLVPSLSLSQFPPFTGHILHSFLFLLNKILSCICNTFIIIYAYIIHVYIILFWVLASIVDKRESLCILFILIACILTWTSMIFCQNCSQCLSYVFPLPCPSNVFFVANGSYGTGKR